MEFGRLERSRDQILRLRFGGFGLLRFKGVGFGVVGYPPVLDFYKASSKCPTN